MTSPTGAPANTTATSPQVARSLLSRPEVTNLSAAFEALVERKPKAKGTKDTLPTDPDTLSKIGEFIGGIGRAVGIFDETYGDPNAVESMDTVVGFYVDCDGDKIDGLSEDWAPAEEYAHYLALVAQELPGQERMVDVGALAINVVGEHAIVDYVGVRDASELRPHVATEVTDAMLQEASRQSMAALQTAFIAHAHKATGGKGYVTLEMAAKAPTEEAFARFIGLRRVEFEGADMEEVVRQTTSRVVAEYERALADATAPKQITKLTQRLEVARKFQARLGNHCNAWFSAPHEEGGDLPLGMAFLTQSVENPNATSIAPSVITDLLDEQIPEFDCTQAEKEVYLKIAGQVVNEMARKQGGSLRLKPLEEPASH